VATPLTLDYEVDLRREAGDVVVLLTDMESSIRDNRSLTQEPKKAAARRIWEIWKRKVEDGDRPEAAFSVNECVCDGSLFGMDREGRSR